MLMSSVEFLPLAVNPRDYPRPCLSMLPSRVRPSFQANPGIQSAFLEQKMFFVYARYALIEAFKRAGIGHGFAVLLPSYHCRTIVESVLHTRAEVRFYPMTNDLRPDFSVMAELVADGKARALLLTHYFGFGNALAESRAFCSQHGIALIEDCAHAFYGTHAGQVLGTVGDYAVASAWKFLPLRDGALLRDNTRIDNNQELIRQPWNNEFKGIASLLRDWTGLSLSQEFSPPPLDVEAVITQVKAISQTQTRPPAPEDIQFRPDHVGLSGLFASRWLVDHANHDQLAYRRRANYQRWLKGVAGLRGASPLFPELSDGVVPYAFPLLTDPEGLSFHAIRLAGIPLWRWEDVAHTDCLVSRDYRLRLLQLPCHQDLTDAQINWMLASLHDLLPKLPS